MKDETLLLHLLAEHHLYARITAQLYMGWFAFLFTVNLTALGFSLVERLRRRDNSGAAAAMTLESKRSRWRWWFGMLCLPLVVGNVATIWISWKVVLPYYQATAATTDALLTELTKLRAPGAAPLTVDSPFPLADWTNIIYATVAFSALMAVLWIGGAIFSYPKAQRDSAPPAEGKNDPAKNRGG